MSFVEDLEYPDNDDREHRANELRNDILSRYGDLIVHRHKIDDKLKDADVEIRAAYSALEDRLVKDETKPQNFSLVDDWKIDVAHLTADFVLTKLALKGITYASKSFLLSQGRIGEAALADLVGLPNWFKFGKVVGGVVALVAIEFALGAITGAVKRDKLRDAISDQIDPRVKFERAKANADIVYESLKAAEMAFRAVKKMGLAKAQLDAAHKNILDGEMEKLAAMTSEAAAKNLAALDKARGSWTNEDPAPTKHNSLKERIDGTVWRYHWNDSDWEFGFLPDGSISKLDGWKTVHWRAVSEDEVELKAPGGKDDRVFMHLHFDLEENTFATSDWDGQPGTGTMTAEEA